MTKPVGARRAGRRHRQSGYILLTLMLFVSLLVIAMLAVYPTIAFEVRRDREEEMVHRGVQYSRAIKRYYKKFGTYPPTLDALENTQNIRFLRKRYKDPVTGKDFKILRVTDIKMSFGPGIQGAQSINGAGGLNSPFGSNTLGQSNTLSSNSSFGSNALAGPNAVVNANSGTPNAGTAQVGAGTPTDPSSPGGQNSGNVATGTEQDSTQSNGQNPNSNSPFVSASGQPAGGTFGGTPIVGVASVSKLESIRVFNKKNHYNEWQFVYDPMSDRGGLLNAPVQPGLQQGIGAPVQGGQPGSPISPTNNGFSNNPGMTSPMSGQGNAGTNEQTPQN